MNKLFVPYQQALELKELRFDEPCFSYYNLDGTLSDRPKESGDDIKLQGDYKFDSHQNNSLNDDESCSAPTFSQAFKFFREKYKLVHEISWSKYKGGLNFDYDVFSLVLPTDDELGDRNDIASDKSMETYDSLVDKGFNHKESNTYEQAELECLKKLIELVKKNNNG